MELDDNSKRRLATAIGSCTVVILSIALRFWCKLSQKIPLRAEDWWILVVLPEYAAATAVDIWGLFKGSTGKEFSEVAVALLTSPSPENVTSLENYLKALYIGYFISTFGLTCIRLSLCCLYRHIFSTPEFRMRSTIVIGVSLAWFITAFVVSLVVCIPLDAFWHPLEPGRCLNFSLYFLLIGVFETVIDAAVLALPVAAVFKVQLPLKTRVIVSSIFLLGVL
ncbi:hypothetical protein HD806DRAFT_533999 [Xylariaceae sp. AK1471]|nr:hypothetical protein HD806DRAFT_533999 [Xylariaceae sp. AK1471]